MFIKVLIISIILITFVMVALGIKMLFNPKAQFPSHSCDLEKEEKSTEEDCSQCELKEIANCSESRNSINH